jgi:hypothetical protein
MTDQRFVIELRGEPAGLVVGERRGFRFYAAASTFTDLEQKVFRSPGHAEDASRAVLAGQTMIAGSGLRGTR